MRRRAKRSKHNVPCQLNPKIEILRYDPEHDAEPHFQTFEVPFDETGVLFDAIKPHQR